MLVFNQTLTSKNILDNKLSYKYTFIQLINLMTITFNGACHAQQTAGQQTPRKKFGP